MTTTDNALLFTSYNQIYKESFMVEGPKKKITLKNAYRLNSLTFCGCQMPSRLFPCRWYKTPL